MGTPTPPGHANGAEYDGAELIKRIDFVLDQVRAELLRAKAKHPGKLASPHEGYAILAEEVDELWDDVKADRKAGEAHKEAIQVAAMAVRFVMEIPIVTNTGRDRVPREFHEDQG